MYFRNFPYIAHKFYDNSQMILTNILRRVEFVAGYENRASLFETYLIQDGETPEDVAQRFYGNPHYYYVILLINNMTDPYYDWCLPEDELMAYTIKKYGAGEDTTVHHYKDSNNNWVSSDTAGASSVTNYEHEQALNEAKRPIKILQQQYLKDFIDEFTKAITS